MLSSRRVDPSGVDPHCLPPQLLAPQQEQLLREALQPVRPLGQCMEGQIPFLLCLPAREQWPAGVEDRGVALQGRGLQGAGRLPLPSLSSADVAVVVVVVVVRVSGHAAGPAGPLLQTAVALAVALQVVLAGEGLVAERALEGAGPAVEGQVVLEVIGVQEAGGAVGAGVRTLPCVLPHVDLQFIIPG